MKMMTKNNITSLPELRPVKQPPLTSLTSSTTATTDTTTMVFLKMTIPLIIFGGSIVLCNLFSLIRTLESDSLESSPVPVNSEQSVPLLYTLPASVLEESSLENSVKYHRLPPWSLAGSNKGPQTNAIVRGSAHKTLSNYNSNVQQQQQQSQIQLQSGSKGINNNNRESEPLINCLTCATSQQNEQLASRGSERGVESESSSLPENTMRAMRLEMIKQQILRKLRLKEPPRVDDLPRDLPIPVALGDTLPRRKTSRTRDRDVEDFYGKTEQVIVFPEDVMPGCVTFTYRNDHPSACFLFNLPKEIRLEEISSAELWVFKLPDPNDGKNQTFYLSRVMGSNPTASTDPYYDDTYDPVPPAARSKLIDVKANIGQIFGWLSMNISDAALRWLRSGQYENTLQIGCKSCGMGGGNSPVGTLGEQRPFIVFNIAGVNRKKRTRRHVNCSPGVTECCRERFVVDFREIGWEWIIGPSSYDAFYCKGSCLSVNSLSSSSARRTSIVSRYLHTHGINNRTAELVPCCTATKMSSISLIYMDRGNNTVRNEILPNMVIESCGCL